MKKADVAVLNMLSELKSNITEKNIEEYYWVNEGHRKAKGYELFAKSIFNDIN